MWQSAARFDPARGNAKSWLLTLAHRRAVDAVRHDQAATNRENKYDWSNGPDFDDVEETVTITLEHEQVRRCLDGLTELQREAVNLAYYQGYTYAEVADGPRGQPGHDQDPDAGRHRPPARLHGGRSMSADLHSLLAPYALDALDDEERTRFEAHLDQCTDCQAELARVHGHGRPPRRRREPHPSARAA